MANTKQQIESAATQAIQKDGVRSVSFRTLAEAVGVKSSSVHYHFPTKPDLTVALVEEYTSGFEQRLLSIAAQESSLTDKVDRLIDVFNDVLEGDDLCLCGMMAAELTSLDDATRSALKRFFALTEHWLEDLFAAEGTVLDMEAADLARVFMSGLEGAILIDRVVTGNSRLVAFRRLIGALDA